MPWVIHQRCSLSSEEDKTNRVTFTLVAYTGFYTSQYCVCSREDVSVCELLRPQSCNAYIPCYDCVSKNIERERHWSESKHFSALISLDHIYCLRKYCMVLCHVGLAAQLSPSHSRLCGISQYFLSIPVAESCQSLTECTDLDCKDREQHRTQCKYSLDRIQLIPVHEIASKTQKERLIYKAASFVLKLVQITTLIEPHP